MDWGLYLEGSEAGKTKPCMKIQRPEKGKQKHSSGALGFGEHVDTVQAQAPHEVDPRSTCIPMRGDHCSPASNPLKGSSGSGAP